MKLKSYIGLRVIKTALGAALAIFIAQLLQLNYGSNAGIIAMLSIQSTKRKSKDLAIMRIGSTILALGIGTFMFTFLGFTPIAFGCYLLVFIPISVKLKFHDGIIPCSVLVTHMLSLQSVAVPVLVNEMLQMVIGASIGFLFNLYMPSLQKRLGQDCALIDGSIQQILHSMATCLRTKATEIDPSLYIDLKVHLSQGYKRAFDEAENRWLKGGTTSISFMEKRMIQYEILYHMRHAFTRLYATYEQTLMVADLTEWIADCFGETDSHQRIFDTIESYRYTFRASELPNTREAFENRATLFAYMNDLEHLLSVDRVMAEAIEGVKV